MPWGVPDKGTAANDIQSILFSEYLGVLQAGVDGKDCVLSGCAVTNNANMAPSVAKGAVLSNGVLLPVTAGTVTITTADATNPRIDLVVVNSSGTKAVRAGTPAAAPKPPARTANDVVLAAVFVAANDTAIGATEIVDMRVIRTQGPITIYKTVAAETTNTTSSAIEALNKANSGVTIPDGLFLSGKTLRCRMGGKMLVNSGTPTIRLVIAYGGTTMFSDISAATTNDADRRAWWLDFDIVAQANNDQSLNGVFSTAAVAGLTAPTTGIGDVWSTAMTVGALSGSAAVDSDSANCKLSVQVTFSVSNSANELVVETATLELV